MFGRSRRPRRDLYNTHILSRRIVSERAIVVASRIRNLDHSILGIPRIAVRAIAGHIAIRIIGESGAGSAFDRDLIRICNHIICTVSSGNCRAVVSTAQKRTSIEAC